MGDANLQIVYTIISHPEQKVNPKSYRFGSADSFSADLFVRMAAFVSRYLSYVEGPFHHRLTAAVPLPFQGRSTVSVNMDDS